MRGALFKLFRHGLVHGRVPSVFSLPSGRELTWILERPRTRANHLRLYAPGTKYDRGRSLPNRFALRVSVDLLYFDLVGALRALRARARVDAALAKRVFDGAALAANAHAPVGGVQVTKAIDDMLNSPDP